MSVHIKKNNSSNINKRSNHLTENKTGRTTTSYFENPGPGLGQTQNVTGLNRLMGLL